MKPIDLAAARASHAADDEHPVEPGAVIFVGKDPEHRFVDIAERLELLVVFAPAEGTRSDDD